jgi:hypothetical protein
VEQTAGTAIEGLRKSYAEELKSASREFAGQMKASEELLENLTAAQVESSKMVEKALSKAVQKADLQHLRWWIVMILAGEAVLVVELAGLLLKAGRLGF